MLFVTYVVKIYTHAHIPTHQIIKRTEVFDENRKEITQKGPKAVGTIDEELLLNSPFSGVLEETF